MGGANTPTTRDSHELTNFNVPPLPTQAISPKTYLDIPKNW